MKNEELSAPSDWLYLTVDDKAAAIEAISDAGEYIESLNNTDMATYTPEQFETLVLVICNSMIKNKQIPF